MEMLWRSGLKPRLWNDGGIAVVPEVPRRPVVLYLLAVPAAVFGEWLVTTL
ncbi:hypothetical protein GCM10027200_67480 [Lentzea nigeriaca]